MDITKVNDMKELKALAYDTMQALEAQQNNLRILQQRIAEVEQEVQQEQQAKK